MKDISAPIANEKRWRDTEAGLVLLGSQCTHCKLKIFPQKELCPGCGSDNTTTVELSPRGRLYSYSTIHIAPTGLTTPYTVGFVDLDKDGVRIFAQIEGEPGSFELDQLVELVLGVIRSGASGSVTGYKFRKAH